jgi:hypothetical protein
MSKRLFLSKYRRCLKFRFVHMSLIVKVKKKEKYYMCCKFFNNNFYELLTYFSQNNLFLKYYQNK